MVILQLSSTNEEAAIDCHTYLGVTIDSEREWALHIKKTVKLKLLISDFRRTSAVIEERSNILIILPTLNRW